jgi:hypothetical protein
MRGGGFFWRGGVLCITEELCGKARKPRSLAILEIMKTQFNFNKAEELTEWAAGSGQGRLGLACTILLSSFGGTIGKWYCSMPK